MILILEATGLYFLLLLFALWWMRTRGLCKLPDGRDWLWGKLSLALEGRVMLSQFSLVAQSCLTLWLRGLQHARLTCPSPTARAYSNSCPLNQWYVPTISSSVIPFSCLKSFPASWSFPVSQFFALGGQSIGVSASASALQMNIQDWFPLGWTGWISLQSMGLSRVLSNTTVQKHQFFSTQLSV